ncbi:MAG: type II secretion system F family protein [Patescibacteria group bacterium]
MSSWLPKTYWIDRLFTTKDPVEYYREQIANQVRHWLRSRVYPTFYHPIFRRSLFIKQVTPKLEFVGLSEEVYQFWKGFLTIIGLLTGLFAYMVTAEAILSPLMLFAPVIAIVGFMIPDFYVLDREQQIRYEIHTDFPRFLDLLYLYTASSAFEHIGGAMYAVSENMTGTLAKQLRSAMSVYRFVDLHTFLDRFASRFDTPLAQDLVSTLRLADTYGGSISEKIGTLASEAHKERTQNAKKAGQRASAALMVPLMLFHFPVAIIIFVAPTALALGELFGW